MDDTTSNRNDPKHVAYYQIEADIIAILWKLHEDRLATNSIKFAYYRNPDTFLHSPFNPWLFKYDDKKHQVTREYATGVRASIVSTWHQLLMELDIDINIATDLDTQTDLAASSLRFVDPYVKELIQEGHTLGKEVSKAVSLSRKPYDLQDNIEAGLTTGTQVGVQLKAFYGDRFKPGIAYPLAMLGLKDIDHISTRIGLPTVFNIFHEPAYPLLDETGLNKEAYRKLQPGISLGCPANSGVSDRTRDFLEKRNAPIKRTMLQEFIPKIDTEFDGTVTNWFKSLNLTEKENIISFQDRELLSGNTRRNVGIEKQTTALHAGKEGAPIRL